MKYITIHGTFFILFFIQPNIELTTNAVTRFGDQFLYKSFGKCMVFKFKDCR